MPQYIFTYNEQDNSFPDRYKVVELDEDFEFLRKNESMTGNVLKTEAIEFLEE